MVKILSIDTVFNSSTVKMDVYEEEVVEHTFSSSEELISTILRQPDIFSAMRLVNEINSLNGYDAVSKYETKKIKEYYNTDFVSSHHEYNMINSKVVEELKTISYKSKCDQHRVFLEKSDTENVKIKKMKRESLNNEFSKMRLDKQQSLNDEIHNANNKLSDLQKAYTKMGYYKPK